jgi:hypothetical protein
MKPFALGTRVGYHKVSTQDPDEVGAPGRGEIGGKVEVPLVIMGCHGHREQGTFRLPEKSRVLMIRTFPLTNNMHDPETMNYITNLSRDFYKELLGSGKDANEEFMKFKNDVAIYLISETFKRFPKILKSHMIALNSGNLTTPLASIKSDLEYLNFILHNSDEIVSFAVYETGNLVPNKMYTVLGSEQSIDRGGVYGKMLIEDLTSVYSESKYRKNEPPLYKGIKNLLIVMRKNIQSQGEITVSLEEILSELMSSQKHSILAMIDNTCNELVSATGRRVNARSASSVKIEQITLNGIREHNKSVMKEVDEKMGIDYAALIHNNPNYGAIMHQIGVIESLLSVMESKGGSRRRRTKRRYRRRLRRTRRPKYMTR